MSQICFDNLYDCIYLVNQLNIAYFLYAIILYSYDFDIFI